MAGAGGELQERRARSYGLTPEGCTQPIRNWYRADSAGPDRPYAARPGFGTLVEAFSGFAEKNGFPDKPPALPNLGLADMIAGLSGAFATLAAVREVEVNGGLGQVVDLSLLEPMLGILGPDAGIYQHTGQLPRRLGNRAEVAAPRNAYVCSDGHWMVMSDDPQGGQRILRRRCARLVDDRARRPTRRGSQHRRTGSGLGDFVAAHAGRQPRTSARGLTVRPVLNRPADAGPPVEARAVDVPTRAGQRHHAPCFSGLSRTPGSIARRPLGEHQNLAEPHTNRRQP